MNSRLFMNLGLLMDSGLALDWLPCSQVSCVLFLAIGVSSGEVASFSATKRSSRVGASFSATGWGFCNNCQISLHT